MLLHRLLLFMTTFLLIGTYSTAFQGDVIQNYNSKASDRTQLIYKHYRLPTSVRPEKYDLRVITHLEDPSDLRFDGEVKIMLHILEDTNNITLHAQNLTIEQSKIELRQLGTIGTENCIKNTATNERYNYLILQLCDVAKKDAEYLLTIPFAGLLNDDLKGYYMNAYYDSQRNMRRWLSVTQFEPTYARRAFPCFDEPAFKAKFTISLGHHKEYTALSNMPLKAQKPMSNKADWIWSEFEESVQMCTYLVAYTVNDFTYLPSNTQLRNRLLFRTWARSDVIDEGKYASIIGPKVLKFYEEIFDMNFPLPKVDQIALPQFEAYAMENWGLVTYREDILLYDENDPSFDEKHRTALTIAHELAHQWFGNLVTMEWWSDLWLNEGFATFISTLGLDFLHPEWHESLESAVHDLTRILKVDALQTTRPISQHVTDTSQIDSMFDAISYTKGSLVIRMMKYFLGDETFRRGINHYLKKHAYNNANQNDLWNALTEASLTTQALPKNYDVKTIMDSWTLQAGYPYINVTRDYEKRTATITQDHFWSGYKSAAQTCWWIPLTYTTKSEQNFNKTMPKTWLECTEDGEKVSKTVIDMPPSDEWVIFNLKMTGVYIVQYDERNRNQLTETLNSEDYETIDVINRVFLIDNAFQYSWRSKQSFDEPLNLVKYLKREKELQPWRVALDNLFSVDRILQKSPDYVYFKKYMVEQLIPIYKHLQGLNATTSRSHSYIQHKELIASWSCRFDVDDCKPRALSYFAAWRNQSDPDASNPIPNELREIVYCTAIRHGGLKEYEFLSKRYVNSIDPKEIMRIHRALRCSSEKRILQRSESLHNDHMKVEIISAYETIASYYHDFGAAKRFFLRNLSTLHKLCTGNMKKFTELLLALAQRVYSPQDYMEFKELIENNPKYFADIEQGVRWALEIAEMQSRWKENNYKDIVRVLKTYFQTPN